MALQFYAPLNGETVFTAGSVYLSPDCTGNAEFTGDEFATFPIKFRTFNSDELTVVGMNPYEVLTLKPYAGIDNQEQLDAAIRDVETWWDRYDVWTYPVP